MNKNQILDIAILMDRVYAATESHERMAVCARDCMLQWRNHGTEMFEKTMSAWEDLCDNDGECNNQEQRCGFWVPAIPL